MEQYTFNKEQIEGIMYGYAAHVQQFDIKAITPSEWLSKNAPAQPSPAKAEQEGHWKSMEQEEPKYGMLRFVRGVILNPEPGITNGEKVHTINQFWDIANYRSYTKKWSCEDDNRKVTHWMDIPPIESDTPPVKEAGQPATGAVWVKASDKLPLHRAHWITGKLGSKDNSFLVRINNGYGLADIFDQGDGETVEYMISVKGDQDYYQDQFHLVEWLDESTSPAPTKDGEINEAMIDAIYEGAELWRQEYDDCRKILKELVDLKMVKEFEGKTEEYKERQPLAWMAAIEFLNVYQHLGE